MTLTTINDLKIYLDEHMGSESNDTIRDAVAGWIQRQPSRPNWGTDWSEYLDTLDLWHIANQLGV